MARFIQDPMTITHVDRSRLAESRERGTVLVIKATRNPSAAESPFFLRVVDLGREPAVPTSGRPFSGFISDSYAMLDGRDIAALNLDRVQFVEGTVLRESNEGTIRPADH